MAVYLSVAPPDGFEDWSAPEWDEWLGAHPWEPAESLATRGTWLVFLYQCRVHARRSAASLSPFLERLMNERPINAAGVVNLQRALQEIARELDDVPSSRLWTGTAFYSPAELEVLVEEAEARTGKRGVELSVTDLWRPLFATIDATLARAIGEGRGVYFGNV